MLLETKPAITPYTDILNPAVLVKTFVEYKTRVLFYSATHIPNILPDEYLAKLLSGTHLFLPIVTKI
jgi:hypothetical protein